MKTSIKNLNDCGKIFQLFGYQFFSVQKVFSLDAKPSKCSKLFNVIWFILSFVIVTSLSAANAFINPKTDFEPSLTAKTALSIAIHEGFEIALVLIYCINSIQSFKSTEKMQKFFKNSVRISQILQREFHFTLNYLEVKKGCFTLFTVSFSFISLMQIYLYFTDDNSSLVRNVLLTVLHFHLAVGIEKLVCLFTIVKLQVKASNECLENMFKNQTLASGLFLKSVKSKNQLEICMKIISLRKIYNMSLENTEIVNISYGFTLLSIFCNMIIGISSICYNFFLMFVGKIPQDQLMGRIITKFQNLHYYFNSFIQLK